MSLDEVGCDAGRVLAKGRWLSASGRDVPLPRQPREDGGSDSVGIKAGTSRESARQALSMGDTLSVIDLA